MAGTVTVVSDSSVNAIINSQKYNAVQAAYPSPQWPIIDGALWIWYTSENTKPDEVVLFISCFNVPGTPTESNINIAADDNFTLFLNGRLLDMKSDAVSYLTNIDMLSQTVTGNNCLHIICENVGSISGLTFKATITYQ